MAYGVFRYYPPRFAPRRPLIYTMPRSATRFVLNAPSVLDDFDRRRHYYFGDYDNMGLVIEALPGDQIMLDGVLSSAGGTLLSVAGEGACCHLAAVNDSTWLVVSYTKNWSVT